MASGYVLLTEPINAKLDDQTVTNISIDYFEQLIASGKPIRIKLIITDDENNYHIESHCMLFITNYQLEYSNITLFAGLVLLDGIVMKVMIAPEEGSITIGISPT